MTDRLYHYTCDHGAESIRRMGYIAPHWHPLLNIRLAWFTDMAEPDPAALGLTATLLHCDRTAHRFEVEPTPAVFRWESSPFVASLPVVERWALHRGVHAARWWASTQPVPIVEAVAP